MKIPLSRPAPYVFPRWRLKIDEVSNGHYKYLFTDDDGRMASPSSLDDVGLLEGESFAFDIEMSINKQPGKFLYGFCIYKLKNKMVETEDIPTGSWSIVHKTKTMMFDNQANELFVLYHVDNLSYPVACPPIYIPDLRFEGFQKIFSFFIAPR